MLTQFTYCPSLSQIHSYAVMLASLIPAFSISVNRQLLGLKMCQQPYFIHSMFENTN